MPNYDYSCKLCGHTCEVFQKITDEPLKECPKCHKEGFHRGPGGGVGLAFKGSGFYINDYSSNTSSSTTSEGSKSGGCCPCGKGKGSCSSSSS